MKMYLANFVSDMDFDALQDDGAPNAMIDAAYPCGILVKEPEAALASFLEEFEQMEKDAAEEDDYKARVPAKWKQQRNRKPTPESDQVYALLYKSKVVGVAVVRPIAFTE